MSTALTAAASGAYDLTPRWTAYPTPVAAQIGGVARASGPVPIGYAQR